MKRVIRYLKGTSDLSLHIKPSVIMSLVAFSYADWAANLDDRRSVAGYCVFLGEFLISWSEYWSLAILAAEVTWIISLLQEICFPVVQRLVLWCDNMSAGALASNPVFHARTKHIEINVHFVRDKLLSQEIRVGYVPSADQTTDILTKASRGTCFSVLRSKLGLCLPPSHLRGAVKGG